MNDWTVVALAYGLGSIPFGFLLVKAFLKQDIRATGSGNIGATNVARSGKKGLAISTLLLDAGKGALAVWIAQQYSADNHLLPYAAAFAAILGHVFPVWLRFKGGKGVATGVGAFALLAPFSVLVALIVFAVVFALTKYVSLASILASAVFPIAAWFLNAPRPSGWSLVAMAGASGLIILKHQQNIRRLMAGTESRFGLASAAKQEAGTA